MTRLYNINDNAIDLFLRLNGFSSTIQLTASRQYTNPASTVAQTNIPGRVFMQMASSYLKFGNMPVVTLLASSSNTTYYVHLHLLSRASPVFKAAFSSDSNFREGTDKTMILHDDDQETVDRMLQWLYKGKFQLSEIDSEENANKRHLELAKLNVLADKYQMPKLGNDIIDIMYESQKVGPSTKYFLPPPMSVMFYIYDNLTGASAFRKLMMCWLVLRLDEEEYKSESFRTSLLENGEIAADFAITLGQMHSFGEIAFAHPRTVHYQVELQEAGGDGYIRNVSSP